MKGLPSVPLLCCLCRTSAPISTAAVGCCWSEVISRLLPVLSQMTSAAPPAVTSPSSTDVPSPSHHSRCIVVSRLAPVLTLAHLEDLFNTIGPIASLHWHQPPPPSTERVCIVEFVHAKHAQTAPLITDTVIGDRAIQILPLTTFLQSNQPSASTPSSPPTASTASPPTASAPPTSSPSPPLHVTALPVTGPPVPSNFIHPPQPLPLPTSLPSAPAFPLDPTFTSSTIYVGNLSPAVTNAVLNDYFSQLGPLVGVQLQADSFGPNRFGFVEFTDPRVAQMALALHGQVLMGRPMKVGKANVGVGRGLITEEERQHRAVGLGAAAGAADKVAEALAKVAAAQQLIANKLGVKVQTPAISTMAPVLAAVMPPVATTPLVVEGGVKGKEGAMEERKVRSRGRGSRSRSRSGSRSRKRSSRSRRHSSSSRSHSPSHSPSRSPSRSGSDSRSPRPRRHRSRREHRRRHKEHSRDRSHRSSRHRRSSSRSLSPRAMTSQEAEKKEGSGVPVGADRWRAEDSEDAAVESKEATSRQKERSRDRDRSRERERSRDRKSSHRRRGEYADGHSSSRRRREGQWSDEGEEVDRHVYAGVGRGGGFRGRRKNGADPHAGMVWDGFSWRTKDAPPATDPNSGGVS